MTDELKQTLTKLAHKIERQHSIYYMYEVNGHTAYYRALASVAGAIREIIEEAEAVSASSE